MTDVAGISIDGDLYEGWQDVSITKSLDQFSHSFSLSFAELWHEGSEPIPINEGAACVIKVDGEPVITGYVDDSVIGYGDNSHTAGVMGRAKTGDLVDCAAIHKTGQFRNATIKQIATALCSPFGIDVVMDAPVGGVFRRYSIQDGETVHEAIDRAARMRALILSTDTDGNLVLTRAGTRKTSTRLQFGVNVLRCSRRGSWRDRFSSYTIKTQAAGADDFFGKAAAQIKRTITDEHVNRYRPYQMQAENEDTGNELKERIIWERNQRAGQARRVTYTVQGWHDEAGDLWEPNTLVPVEDSFARINTELLIATTRQSQGASGTFTEIEVCQKEAYDTIELAPPKPQSTGSDYFA